MAVHTHFTLTRSLPVPVSELYLYFCFLSPLLLVFLYFHRLTPDSSDTSSLLGHQVHECAIMGACNIMPELREASNPVVVGSRCGGKA